VVTEQASRHVDDDCDPFMNAAGCEQVERDDLAEIRWITTGCFSDCAHRTLQAQVLAYRARQGTQLSVTPDP